MFKTIKQKIREIKQKQRLKKEGKYFDLEAFSFSKINVLIIDEVIPEFNKDSGSRRLTEIIKMLLKNKVSVFLLADLKQHKYKSDYIEKFKTLGVNVYEPCIETDGSLVTKERFIQLVSSKIQIAWLHRPLIFKKYSEILKGSNSKIKLVFDMVDFHYIRLLREYELNKDENLKISANEFLNIELENCKQADVIIAISETDKILLLEHYNIEEKIKVISNIHQHIKKEDTFHTFKSRKDLLFIGSYRHQPNEDAVVYLKNEIMPLIWERNPEITVYIIGSYLTPQVESLETEHFKVLGFVDDVSTYFKSIKLFLAPLRFGAGIKGKIGQSLEHSLPVVTTDVGAEGFGFGSCKKHMVFNTAEAFAQGVLELYENETLWNEASDSCEIILEPFSLKKTEEEVLDILVSMSHRIN